MSIVEKYILWNNGKRLLSVSSVIVWILEKRKIGRYNMGLIVTIVVIYLVCSMCNAGEV